MTQPNKDRMRRLAVLAAKAFILASVAAVIVPMPQYAGSLGNAQYIVWLARLVWVLLLTVGFVAVLLLVGFLARKLQPG